MNILIGFIILAAFLQTSFVGVNLVLLLLVIRGFIIESSANYFLAFFSGILVGILAGQNVGFWALIYLLCIIITHGLRKLPFNRSLLTSIPVTTVAVLIATTIEWVFFHQTINWLKPISEILVSVPLFMALDFWEDRFMVHTSTVKLRLKK